jgi:hypothetical protein
LNPVDFGFAASTIDHSQLDVFFLSFFLPSLDISGSVVASGEIIYLPTQVEKKSRAESSRNAKQRRSEQLD